MDGTAEDVDLYLRIGAVVALRPWMRHRLRCDAVTQGNSIPTSDLAWAGIMRLVQREKAGAYAGGTRYAKERRRLISDCGRFYVPQLLSDRRWSQAFRLGLPTLLWTLRYETQVLPGWMRTCWKASIRSPRATVG